MNGKSPVPILLTLWTLSAPNCNMRRQNQYRCKIHVKGEIPHPSSIWCLVNVLSCIAAVNAIKRYYDIIIETSQNKEGVKESEME